MTIELVGRQRPQRFFGEARPVSRQDSPPPHHGQPVSSLIHAVNPSFPRQNFSLSRNPKTGKNPGNQGKTVVKQGFTDKVKMSAI